MSDAMTTPREMAGGGEEAPLVAVGAEDWIPVRDGSVDEGVVRAFEALVVVPPAAARVVDANPMPLGPILMVWPFTTIVVGVAEGPIPYVVPDITT